MKITIGILAHNEALNIEKTLTSLFEQTVFTTQKIKYKDFTWAINVVPNGCRDNTYEITQQYLELNVSKIENCNINYQVISLAKPGKSNAWNELVHNISDKDSDYFIFIDADIMFGFKETIENSLDLLFSSSADVVVDSPLKFFDEKSPKLIRIISEKASTKSAGSIAGIAGSFYCVSASKIREVWLPVGLSGEDGFVYAMTITDKFRKPINTDLVIAAKNASHYYEGLTSLKSIIHHEVRLVIGTTLNCYLTWDTFYFLIDPDGAGAGVQIRDLNKNKPNWYKDFITNSIKKRGYWVLPSGMLGRRLHFLKNMTLNDFYFKIPLFVIAFIFDAYIFLKANSKLKNGTGLGFW